MANIKIIQPDDATGYLEEIYHQILESRGKIAEVYKVQSLNPRSIIRHLDLYLTLMFGKSPLSRARREMIAVVVSASNECDYCIKHHSSALDHYWKDKRKVNRLIQDYTKAGLGEHDEYLCELAQISTRVPGSRKIPQILKKLKNSGADDRTILDATLIISYFNFVNRIVLILDPDPEDSPEGYIY